MPSRVVGWGGTLAIEGSTIPVRNVTITRQATEIDITEHSDTKMFSLQGRVKRGGSFEAYVGNGHSTIFNGIEGSFTLANPASLVWTESSGGTTVSMEIVITGADLTFAADDAAIYTVTFTESKVIS